MVFANILTVILIGFCATANGDVISVQHRLPSGDSNIYVRGIGDEQGMVATYSTTGHPTRADAKLIVTAVSDGRETMVKNVYDSIGRMIDCDVRVSENGTRQFVTDVETMTKNQNQLPPSQFPRLGGNDLLADVQSQVARCENFLRARVSEDAQQQQRLPIELELDGVVDDDETVGKSRQKRAYLIWPGTNWCGKGSKAEFAESYGENMEADKCCQKHDQCPYIIEGFTTKYNLFNYRIHTLSICDCDEIFMGCLKAANTSTATMVGKVYFNVVNTDCFDLKLKKTCSKRSWWGGCEKYTTKWAANIRSLGNFPE